MASRFRTNLRKDLQGLPRGRAKAWHHLLARGPGKRRSGRSETDEAGEPVVPRRPNLLSGGAGAELVFDD